MKIAYVNNLKLGKANKQRLETINGIIEEYIDQGYVMTLRQLYYQLVSRDVIPNQQKEYAKLSSILKQGRMAGIVDWDAIEDRGRLPKHKYHAEDPPDAINDILNAYRLDRVDDQEYYMEVWVEKDALSNIFLRVTEKYHVRLMVNKGYSSCSAMHEASKRFKQSEKEGILFYFGDHDPSGKDMVRDIRERMEEFGVDPISVINPALNMDQIRRYNLPTNPAKISDPRAADYIAEYGDKSWELDALEPGVLVNIIEASLSKYIDTDLYLKKLDQEKVDKAWIRKIADNYYSIIEDFTDLDPEENDEETN